MNKTASNSCAFVIIYNAVALYPPTINAIELLSQRFAKIIVVELITMLTEPSFENPNIEVHSVSQNKENYLQSIGTFYRFTKLLSELSMRERPLLVLFYDTMAAMSVYLSLFWKRSTAIFWYHNHDVVDKNFISKFSLQALATMLEVRMIQHCDIFSLPSDERKKYFRLEGYGGKYALIPNYPSKKLFGDVKSAMQANQPMRIVYQGSISTGHGFEEIIQLLPFKINNKLIKLELKGIVSETYKRKLEELIKARNCGSFVTFYEFTAYNQLPKFTAGCHVGLAVYTEDNIMYSTLGTASNKAYEYTACGMPFIYFKNDHFDLHFADMPWAISTDLTKESLIHCLEIIEEHYNKFSEAAKHNFLSERNFEAVFTPVLNENVKNTEAK